MGSTLATVLPLAFGIAISPVPIITTILTLFAPRARSTGPCFMLGYLLGTIASCVLVLWIAHAAGIGSKTGGSPVAAVIKLNLGLVFLFLAVGQVRKLPRFGGSLEMPRWMKVVDSLDAAKAGGLGFALSAFNPTNVAVVIPSMMLVAQARGSMAEQVVEVGLFTLVAAAPVILAVAYYLAGGSSAHAHLDRARAWLTKHNAAALLVLLVGLGILLTVQGVNDLPGA